MMNMNAVQSMLQRLLEAASQATGMSLSDSPEDSEESVEQSNGNEVVRCRPYLILDQVLSV